MHERKRVSVRAGDRLQWMAGVDGCRGGWMVVLAAFAARSPHPAQVAARLCTRFADVLRVPETPVCFAVDMPIGLLDRAVPGGRACDREARALLGRPRASSVFTPPVRGALVNDGYADAIARNGARMSMQSYNILPRMREVDEAMTAELQAHVMEAHPELAFAALAGRAMRHNKKTANGRRERMQCLRRAFGPALRNPLRIRLELGPRAVALDDVIDACVLALVARGIHTAAAGRVPAESPPVDARGLRMEIWY